MPSTGGEAGAELSWQREKEARKPTTIRTAAQFKSYMLALLEDFPGA